MSITDYDLIPSPFQPTPRQLAMRVRLMRARHETVEALRSVGEALERMDDADQDAHVLIAALSALSETSHALDVALARWA